MNNPDTDLIFPLRVLPSIADAHDAEWKALVDFTVSAAADEVDRLSVVLTMARLSGCVSCNSDSFRAMRGCTQCALQTIRRQHMSGVDLRKQVTQNRKEVESYLKNRSSLYMKNDGKIVD